LPKDNGETVAATGNKATDSLALIAAGIGFSLGITGTVVAKKLLTSSLILMGDNFPSIVKAIVWIRAASDAFGISCWHVLFDLICPAKTLSTL
jgi:P-type Ca2+ transporter type 2C